MRCVPWGGDNKEETDSRSCQEVTPYEVFRAVQDGVKTPQDTSDGPLVPYTLVVEVGTLGKMEMTWAVAI